MSRRAQQRKVHYDATNGKEAVPAYAPSAELEAYIEGSVSKEALGLGPTDTVEFGAFIPPAGTTAEIDAVTTATVGQVIFDTDRNRQVRFTGAAAYIVTGFTSASTYYVDPQGGNDTSGSVGGVPFLTIHAALTQAVSDGASPIIVQCLSGFYSEEDALDGISSSASVSIIFDIGSVYYNGSMTDFLFDATNATLPNLNYIGGNLSWNTGAYGFFKGPAATNSTTLEIEAIGSPSSSSTMFEITGGRAKVLINGFANYAFQTQTIIEVSGTADVTCVGLNAFYALPVAIPAKPSTKLSGTATLKLINVSIENAGLCEITSDTACKLIIRDCNCSGGPFPNPALTVKAPSGSSNPEAFALGVNAVTQASTDITVDTTFGQFIVDSSAVDLF